MPEFTCAKCGRTSVVTSNYSSMSCMANGCGGKMYQPGSAPPNRPPPPPPGFRPPIIPLQPIAVLPPPLNLPPPIFPPPGNVARVLPPPPPPMGNPVPPRPPRPVVPGHAVMPAQPRRLSPQKVDPAELLNAVAIRHQAAINRARVNKTLIFSMTPPGGATMNFNLPIKYLLWTNDASAQSPTVIVEIPIKVHSGPAGLAYWKSKGYSDDSFGKTIHKLTPVPPATEGLPATGIIAAAATEAVLKSWSAKINNCWGNVGVVWEKPSGQTMVYRLQFQFAFADDPQDAAAQVVCVRATGDAAPINPTGTVDAIRWGVDDIESNRLGPICHEVGHLIGNPDEYFTIAYEGQTKNWGPGYRTGNGIGTMNNPDMPPLMRYYKLLALELALTFSIPVAQAYLVPNPAMPNQGRLRLDAAFWP